MAQITRETEKGTEVRCPNCGQWALVEDYRSFTLNPHYVTELTPVLQCHAETERGACMHIFAPTALAFQMRTRLLAGMEGEE
jgi:hypothetical protein